MTTMNGKFCGLLLITFSLLGSGCDDDSLTGSETDTINNIPVPPEPDVTQNKATIAGVDTNSNGVRDDVERVIAKEFGNNFKKHDRATNMAQAGQILLTGSKNVDNIIYYKSMTQCLLEYSKLPIEDMRIIENSTLDTPDRLEIYRNALAGRGVIRGVNSEYCDD